MPELVCGGASLTCSQGSAPCSLIIPPSEVTKAPFQGAATIISKIPMTNIPGFAMCRSPMNPAVAAATAAASGVLTPQACTPLLLLPWMPGSSKVKVGIFPALPKNAKLICNFGGSISITNPGQTKVTIS